MQTAYIESRCAARISLNLGEHFENLINELLKWQQNTFFTIRVFSSFLFEDCLDRTLSLNPIIIKNLNESQIKQHYWL